ncbi:hypothetical protein [Halobacillus yeomjeoni]|uniref:Gram-positive cocci surface proteins LPxTG domain-containing protein n=1 Tax=Halobacillus yeomjeoni TaxID=311194 RepID=A0A931HXX5_9BACI|nr:hypothetical protein [Halobacillus yeomjeoni]MBH0231473.1 hypothetical protein [Halobacillus yeomjeoni]
MKRFMAVCFLFLFALMVHPMSSGATSWAYPFVVWDGYVYEITEEPVSEVEEEIGEVTAYNDMAQERGNFSNALQEGTPYYKISGVSSDKAIAVKDRDGTLVKAVRLKEYTYEGMPYHTDSNEEVYVFLGIGALIGLLILFRIRSLKKA